MNYLIILLAILIFVVLWTVLINRFLPRDIVSSNNNDRKYDERQSKIFTEVLARTCVWLIYSMLWNLILKMTGYLNNGEDIIGMYNEIIYLVIAVIWAIISYIVVKKKYTPKEGSYEE